MTHLLDPDIYRRAAWPALPTTRRRTSETSVFGVLMAVSLALLAMGRIDMPLVGTLRAGLQDVAAEMMRLTSAAAAPALGFAREAAEWRNLAADRDRLRAQNERLSAWEARAHVLEQQVAALSRLAHAVAEQPTDFITARVVSSNSGPFVRAALLDAGRDQGVKSGLPALGAQGLVGRVLAAGRTSSRLLLLTDVASSIPVVIGGSALRAVIQGDNSPLPRIAYLPAGSQIQPGDDVVTSGVGGVFPAGLKVGIVVDTGDALRIEPAARFDRLDYVSVLLVPVPSPSPADDELATQAQVNSARKPTPRWAGRDEGGLDR